MADSRNSKVSLWKDMAQAAFLWGTAFPAIRVALDGYRPTEIAALRTVVALLVMALCARRGRIGVPARRDLPALAAFGVTGMTGYQLLLYTGERTAGSGVAAMVICMSPVFGSVLGFVFLKEQVSLRGVSGLGVALSGALLMAFVVGQGGGAATGVLTVLAAAALQAVSFVVQKPLLARCSGLECTFYGSLFALLPILPALPSAISRTQTAGLTASAATVWLGAGCTVLAFRTWSRVLAATTTAISSLVLYGVPLAALAIEATTAGALPGPGELLGGVLVLAGVAVATTRPAAPGLGR